MLICEKVCTALWNAVLKSVMVIWHSFRWSPQEHLLPTESETTILKIVLNYFSVFKVIFKFFLIWDLIFRQDYKLWWKISKGELLSGVHKGFLSHNSMNRSISAARIWTIRGSTDFSQSNLTVVAALCWGFITWGICF